MNEFTYILTLINGFIDGNDISTRAWAEGEID
jgi:hypothetical protein